MCRTTGGGARIGLRWRKAENLSDGETIVRVRQRGWTPGPAPRVTWGSNRPPEGM
jgi:hypothetical protein